MWELLYTTDCDFIIKTILSGCCGTGVFNITRALHVEDCRDWWLPGVLSSVIRALAAQTRGPEG